MSSLLCVCMVGLKTACIATNISKHWWHAAMVNLARFFAMLIYKWAGFLLFEGPPHNWTEENYWLLYTVTPVDCFSYHTNLNSRTSLCACRDWIRICCLHTRPAPCALGTGVQLNRSHPGNQRDESGTHIRSCMAGRSERWTTAPPTCTLHAVRLIRTPRSQPRFLNWPGNFSNVHVDNAPILYEPQYMQFNTLQLDVKVCWKWILASCVHIDSDPLARRLAIYPDVYIPNYRPQNIWRCGEDLYNASSNNQKWWVEELQWCIEE